MGMVVLGWEWLCWDGNGCVGMGMVVLGWEWLCWDGNSCVGWEWLCWDGNGSGGQCTVVTGDLSVVYEVEYYQPRHHYLEYTKAQGC